MKQAIRTSMIPLLAAALSFAAPAATAQSRPKNVLDQMIQALGGPAFLQVQEIHVTGRFFPFTRGELSGVDVFADYIKFPDMERTEFGKEKNKSITINKGKGGWKIEGKKDPEPVTPAEGEEFLAAFKTTFDYVTRFVFKEPKTTVQSLGSEIINFNRADVIEIRDADKNRIRFFIDRQTRLPIKMQVRRSDKTKLTEELYGNWHEFQGVMTPLFVGRFTEGVKTMEIRAETAEYDPGFAADLFEAPSK